MAIRRDPQTGLLVSTPDTTSLPARTPGANARPVAQLPANATIEPRPSLFRSFVNAPRDLFKQAFTESLPALGRAGVGLTKEVGHFLARPLVAPFAGLSEDLATRARGQNPWSGDPRQRTQQTGLSRYAFQNTAPESKERGFAAAQRAVEAASFLPELMIPGGVLSRKGLSLTQRGIRSAAVETPFGLGLGYLDARRRGLGHREALPSTLGGGLIAAGTAFGLPFAGAGLRRVVGPFIPKLATDAAATARGAKAIADDIGGVPPPPPPPPPGGAVQRATTQTVVTDAVSALETPAARAAREAAEAESQALRRQLAVQAAETTPTPPAAALTPDTLPAAPQRGVIAEEAAQIPSAASVSTRVESRAAQEAASAVPAAAVDVPTPSATALPDANAIIARNLAERRAARTAGTPQGILPKATAFIRDLDKKIGDFKAPVERVLDEAEAKMGLSILPEQDFRAQAQRVFRSPTIAAQLIKETDLPAIIREAEALNAFDELGELLLARRNEELRTLRPEIALGRSAADDQAIIAALEPRLGALADRVNIAAQPILDIGVDSGLVGRQAAADLKRQYPRYVPIDRVFSIIEDNAGYKAGGGLASVSSQKIVQGLKGSERAQQNPIESIVERFGAAVQQAERNKAARTMASMRSLPDNPFGIVPLRTAEKVKERMSIWKALKESKPFKLAMQRILRSEKKAMRDLMVELRRLNVKGLKIALRRSASDAPRPKTSGLVDIEAFLTKKGLPKEKKALERALTSMRAGAADLRAELAALNAEGYMRGLARESVSLPPRAGMARKVDASLGRKVNEPLLNRVIAKIEARDPKLAARLRTISDLEKRLAEVKEAIRTTTKKETEEMALVERALKGQKLNVEDKFAEIPATLSDDETIAFVDSLIKLPDAELASVKKMIANREPKLAGALARVDELKTMLGALNEARAGMFMRGRELADVPVPEGKKKFSVMRDGIREDYAIDPEFADVISNTTPIQLSILEKTMAAPTRVFKIGTTGPLRPVFALFNMILDQATGFFNSRHFMQTSVNPFTFVQAAFETLGHGKLFQEAVREGAITTSYALLRDQAAFNISRARAGAGLGAKIRHLVRHPSDLLKLPAEMVEGFIGRSEELRRMQEYIGTKKALTKTGMSPERVRIMAAEETRNVTANFFNRGEWGRTIGAVFPYLRSSINGIRAFQRSWRLNPTGMAAKIGAFALMPMAVVTAWNLKDPKRKAAYDDIPDYEKANNIIILPENPTKGADGRWNAIKIPFHHEIIALMGPVRRMFEAAHGLDPLEFSDFADGLIGGLTAVDVSTKKGERLRTAASVFTPQVIKPALESYTNKNFFTGAPIVSAKLADLEPSLQVKPNTSGIARLIAGQIDASPLKVEAWLRSTFGSGTDQIINTFDRFGVTETIQRLPFIKKVDIPPGTVGGRTFKGAVENRLFSAAAGASDAGLYERAGELRMEGRSATYRAKQDAAAQAARIVKLPQREQNAALASLRRQDPKLYDKVKDELKDLKLGLTADESAIKSLGVEDGTRARLILEQEEGMSPAEIAAYEANLVRKKILTKAVKKQLAEQRRKGGGKGVALPPRPSGGTPLQFQRAPRVTLPPR